MSANKGLSMQKPDKVEVLKDVLDAMLDPVNQLFLHSHMLRSWGHSLGQDRHQEWINKMRRARTLAMALGARGATPRSRAATELDIGTDSRTVLDSDAVQTREFIVRVERALEDCETVAEHSLLEQVRDAEQEDLVRLDTWCGDTQARERPKNRKHLMPKPGGAQSAIDALDVALPDMTAAVSQFFYYSLIFEARHETECAARELDAAVTMMFRTQALLERLLDLGGIPGGVGHGHIDIEASERAADATALRAHLRIAGVLEQGLGTLAGFVDPMTHTLIDGVLRSERAQIGIRKSRLEGRL